MAGHQRAANGATRHTQREYAETNVKSVRQQRILLRRLPLLLLCATLCVFGFALLSAAARHLSLTVSAKLKSKVSTKSTAECLLGANKRCRRRLRRDCSVRCSRRRRFWQSARAPHSQTQRRTHREHKRERETGGKANGEKMSKRLRLRQRPRQRLNGARLLGSRQLEEREPRNVVGTDAALCCYCENDVDVGVGVAVAVAVSAGSAPKW